MKNKPSALVLIKVKGLNQLRLLTTLTKNGVVLYEINSFSPNLMNFCVAKKDIRKTFAILKKMCYNYTVEGMYSIRQALKVALERAGLIVGAVVFVLMVAFFQNRILRVTTNIQDGVVCQRVKQAVSQYLPPLASADSVDLTKLKSEITQVEGIADCNLQIKGNSLFVSAVLKTDLAPKEQEYERITSSHDAVITEIVANKGNIVVKVGEVVKKGDLLIDGKVYDATGENLLQTVAQGRVWGEIVIRKTLIVKDETEFFVKTGNKTIKTFLSFGEIPRLKPPYEYYDTTISSCDFNLFVVAKYTKVVFEEKEKRIIKTDFDQVAQREAEKMRLENGLVGYNYSYTVYPTGQGVYAMTINIKTNLEIGIGQ